MVDPSKLSFSFRCRSCGKSIQTTVGRVKDKRDIVCSCGTVYGKDVPSSVHEVPVDEPVVDSKVDKDGE